MNSPLTTRLRSLWRSGGFLSSGRFRRWAFASALIAVAAGRVWNVDALDSQITDDAIAVVGPPSGAAVAPAQAGAAGHTDSATLGSGTQRSSYVTPASYWDAPTAVPEPRPVRPTPAVYPESTPAAQTPTAPTAPAPQTLPAAPAKPNDAFRGTALSSGTLPGTPPGIPHPTGERLPALSTDAASYPADNTLTIPSSSLPAPRTIQPGHAFLPSARGPVAGNQSSAATSRSLHAVPSQAMSPAATPFPADTTGDERPIHVFPQTAGNLTDRAASVDDRPTSILPPHLQADAAAAQPGLSSARSSQTRTGRLTAQARQLEAVPQEFLPPIPTTPRPTPTPDPISDPLLTVPGLTPGNSQPADFAPAQVMPNQPPNQPPNAATPGYSYDLPVNPPAATVSVPGESADLLSWWEQRVTGSVFSGRQPMNLTLEQALGLALAEAPELEILHSDWFIRQVEIARQDAAFDWTSFVEGVWNRDSVPVSSSLDGATNRLRSRTSSGQAGLRRLLRDGGELEFSQVIGTENSNSQFISPNNQGTSRLQMEWTHRLLRGGGEAYNSSRIRIAAIENDSAFDLFQEGVQDHLLNVASSYWILVLRRGRFVQTVTSWKRATDVAQEMSRRVDLDVSPAMLDRARSEVATRLAAAIEAQHDAYRAQDALLRLIYGPEFVQYAQREVITQTLPMKQAPPVAADPQIERAIRNRSEVHRSIRNIKIAAVQYEVAEDEILPVLDMTLTGYAAGLRGNNDVGGSIANQFTQGEPGVGIGFNFEVPYRNRAALAAAEQARVAIRRMQAELETTIADVSEDVRDQVVQRNKYGAVLRQQWESLARSRRLLKTIQTRRRYLADGARVADLYLENLLQTQERLELAESRYLQSQIRFAVADNALLRAVSMIDTLAAPTGSQAGPAAAVREAVSRKSSSFVDPSGNPPLGGYAPMDLDAVYEPPQPPIAR